MRRDRELLRPSYTTDETILGRLGVAKVQTKKQSTSTALNVATNSTATNDYEVSDMMKRYREEQKNNTSKSKIRPKRSTAIIVGLCIFGIMTAGLGFFALVAYLIFTDESNGLKSHNNINIPMGIGYGVEYGLLDVTGIHPASIFRDDD